MELTTFWFILISVLWIGYFFLEGFDFGVGMLLHPLGASDADRRVMINTIGPVWDGNEVWLLTAGGAMFAAFPFWYATLFSGFYLPLFLILMALIFRGVAFEYRGKIDSARWRRNWDLAIAVGSWVPAVLWGVAFANIVRGDSRARRSYLANAFALIGFTQGMVDMSVWWAAYSKAIKEGKAEDMAVSIADQTVIDTQGSGMLKDLSQAMRGGHKQSAYAKLFTSFYQFSNTQYSLLSAQLRTAPSMGKAAADAFTILVVGAFFEEMLRTLLKPSPDDEEPEDLAKALIANQIDFAIGLPFGGGELRGIGDMIVGEQAMQYRGPSGLRMVGEARTFAGQTLQGEFDRAWTRSAINMFGLIWGIPSAQINDTIDGIEAAVEGEVEGVEAALAPITGVRR